MKNILVLLATTTVLGACADNKVQPSSADGSQLFDNPPAAFACPKRSVSTDAIDAVARVAAVDASDVVAPAPKESKEEFHFRTGMAQYFEDRLTEEKLYARYMDGWLSKTNVPSLKPLSQREIDQNLVELRREARAETKQIMRRLAETGVTWAEQFRLFKAVIDARYDNGNEVAPDTIKGKILYGLVWCHESML